MRWCFQLFNFNPIPRQELKWSAVRLNLDLVSMRVLNASGANVYKYVSRLTFKRKRRLQSNFLVDLIFSLKFTTRLFLTLAFFEFGFYLNSGLTNEPPVVRSIVIGDMRIHFQFILSSSSSSESHRTSPHTLACNAMQPNTIKSWAELSQNITNNNLTCKIIKLFFATLSFDWLNVSERLALILGWND